MRKIVAKAKTFEDTTFGRHIKERAPLEFRLLKQVSGGSFPDADLIEAVSYSSRNEYFKTGRFRMDLITYRNNFES